MNYCAHKLGIFVIALLLLACQSSYEKDPKQSEIPMSNKPVIGYQNRDQLLDKLNRDRFDVLIIGGGATGAGAALDAATRGLKTALIEAHDFSFGTSSRSTKLVHGGVRYLENAIKHFDHNEYALVRDALAERNRFLENAPHLAKPLPIITPVYSLLEAGYYLMGLKIYDLVAGASSLGHSRFLSREKSLELFPMLKKDGLRGSVLYYDGQFDDARMNLTLILSAIREGAIATNYVRVEELIKDDGKVIGAMVQDMITGEKWPVYAKVVINACGSFADHIRQMDDKNAKPILTTSQGSHIILPQSFSSKKNGLIIPKTADGRVLFLLPWQGKTLAGTTDQPQDNTEKPKASKEEVDYILAHIEKYFSTPIKRSDIIATWSGLRPLVTPDNSKNTAAISRDHLIDISASNLITIVGGKWTTYRKMAQDVVDAAISSAKLFAQRPSQTKNLKLVGARFFNENLVSELKSYGLDQDVAEHLAQSYGDRADLVMNVSPVTRLVRGYPFLEGEVIYAVQQEYAVHATDILARRTRLAFLDNQAAFKALPTIVSLMARELKWDQSRINQELKMGEEFLETMH